MRFIRKSIIGKAILLLLFILSGVVGGSTYLKRNGVDELPADWVLYGVVGLLVVLFFAFVWDVFLPVARVTKQITNLLTGRIFKKVLSDIYYVKHLVHQG